MIGLHRHVLGNQMPLLTIGGGSLAVVWMLVSIVTSLSSSSVHWSEIRSATARVLAEELAVRVVADGECRFERFGYRAAGRVLSEESGEELQLVIEDPQGEVHRYRAALLSGAVPEDLAHCLSIAGSEDQGSRSGPEWDWLDRPGIPKARWLPGGLPQLVDSEVRNSLRSSSLVADSSVGLLALVAGTDREDFVPQLDEDGLWRPVVPESGVLRVPGNLWLRNDGRSIEVHLDEALTVSIEGNLYLDSNLHVRGEGQLFLVTRERPGSCYEDVDLDGRFSSADRLPDEGDYRGYLEGSGVVHLGLPETWLDRVLRIDASLYVEGELVLRAGACEFGGSVLLGRGLTLLRPDAGLRFSADHLPQVHRSAVPGFEVGGELRPGQLTAAPSGAFSGFGPSIPGEDR